MLLDEPGAGPHRAARDRTIEVRISVARALATRGVRTMRRRTMTLTWTRRHIASVVFLVAVSVAWLSNVAAALAQPPACQFKLGFVTLHDLIPDVVGACVDDEFHDPQTGDAPQHTTRGLLVWRKSDNWTAFTDGFQSWVNGPLGLQQRLNTQRWWWEAKPDHLAVVPAPQPGERCHTAGLDLSLLGVDVGLGNLVGTFRFTNWLDVDCTFFAYPGAQLLDDLGNLMQTTVVRGGSYFTQDRPPSDVHVPAHGAAIFRIHWEQVPVGNEPTCSMASFLAITPPDEYVSLTLPIEIRACGGGHLDISTVRGQ